VRNSQRGQLHFEITIYPLENFIKTGVVILVDDVTQMIQSENKLIEKDKLSAMGELSSVMAFDINAPIKKITEAVASLEQQPSQDLLFASSLAEIKEQSQRASAIVKNLLEFSGASPGAFQPHNILDIIDHSIELSKDILTSSEGIAFIDIEIERMYEEDLPEIPCYQSELQQVFVSLFRYCLQAIQKAKRDDLEPKITVQVLTSYDVMWVKVSHNGLGIDLDEQQVIFEPFFSDDVINEDKHKEASQRLSFPYFIVTQHHHGHMAVTSNVDIGTTFHLELPLK
jgi:signal transduction histidine kinase